ncbi:Ppx/GppA family phosphatase [Acidiferrimicrobium sp. IK]|uniref:Ppx/GppA phosphatase family protein n=1 Tax=Acidiferrimicrobium sp. IK TaxID=2871700 RepID=UPI0021CB4E28|nr:Ppx/GppA phosphatase family protein [Acidiferrimicrobium sp. IK]MCU4187065.1 Ppx/GppA family phosphatase [Acidiferrimicrobium sp. IK]
MPERAVAAIDCGTNSTRLLVADLDGRPLERLMRITRLGKGVDQTRTLDPQAVQRTVAVLREYREVMDRHGVGPVRMTATSAARDASNRQEFFSAATEAAGAAPELLTGDEEGQLSFAGATAQLPAGGQYLVADIGGGSTELAVGPGQGRPVAVRSLDVGCVRLTERFLHADPPEPEEIADATAEVDRLLAAASRDQPAFGQGRQLIGLAGTVAALAALDQGLVGYDRDALHHYRLTREAVDGLLAALASEPVAARVARPSMEKARADVIVGGAIVLSALLRHFQMGECLTSEADILDGLVMSLLRPAT